MFGEQESCVAGTEKKNQGCRREGQMINKANVIRALRPWEEFSCLFGKLLEVIEPPHSLFQLIHLASVMRISFADKLGSREINSETSDMI